MKRVSILGSTGSIGVQALEVVQAQGFEVVALTAHRNVKLLEQQIRRFRPKFAALADQNAAKTLAIAVKDTPTKVTSIEDCATQPCDILLNSIVGIAGLEPTLRALEAGNQVALANKESLVAGGALVTKLAHEKSLPILPVDSEHSAVFQCLQGGAGEALARVILTASGGAFFGQTREALEDVTANDALKHPIWRMGAKITVDSATMFNKGLEVIEAAWLFDLPVEQIDVVVHRQGIVHSLAEYNDGAVLAQLGLPDMRLPIQYALTHPERLHMLTKRLNLAELGTLTFEAPDDAVFPAIELCKQAWRMGGLTCAALNGANEAANELFLQGRLRFLDIARCVEEAMYAAPSGAADHLEDIFAADEAARKHVKESGVLLSQP